MRKKKGRVAMPGEAVEDRIREGDTFTIFNTSLARGGI